MICDQIENDFIPALSYMYVSCVDARFFFKEDVIL